MTRHSRMIVWNIFIMVWDAVMLFCVSCGCTVPPQVTQILPTSGMVAGGTSVTVSGTGFIASNQLVCRFGTFAVVAAQFVSSTHVECPSNSVGAGDVGTVALEISNNNQDYTTNAVEFDYSRTYHTALDFF